MLGVMQTDEWYHVAAVSGREGMKLYLDGGLLGTNSFTGSFAALKSGARFRLGRSVVDAEPLVDGQLAEVRVWKVARSEAQIRQTMLTRLTGKEPDLAGYWNFEDGTANDASPGAHHGTLVGAAKIVAASLPSSGEVVPWRRLTGIVTDAKGGDVFWGALIRAEVNGTELGRATSTDHGDYALTLRTRAEAVDLIATAPKDLIAWR